MEKLIKYILIILLIALIPFIYFWVRDVGNLNKSENVESCIPYDLIIDSNRFSFTAFWKTKNECVGYIKLTDSIKSDSWDSFVGEGELNIKNEHSITVEDLKPGKDYYFSIVSDGIIYGEDGFPIKVRTDD